MNDKKQLTENQMTRIDALAEMKRQFDILSRTIDKEKEALLAELGLGVYVTDNTILSFAEQERRTTQWKEIAEENIEPHILDELIPGKTNRTMFVTCRTTKRE